MYVVDVTPYEDYLNYYSNQVGHGYAHPGISTFKGSVYQRGDGLGSIFAALFRSLTPLLRSNLAKSVGRQILSSGVNLGSDVLSGQNFKSSLKRRAQETGINLLNDTAAQLRGQTGEGIKKKRKKYKRRQTAVPTTGVKSKKRPKKKTAKKKKKKTGASKKKRKTKRKSVAKKLIVPHIFK